MSSREICRPLCVFLSLAWATPLAADWKVDTGYTRLLETYPAAVPLANTRGVVQVEADEDSSPDFLRFQPNPGLAEFVGKTFTIVSPGGTGNSGHATTVGTRFYGSTSSVLPGAMGVAAYSVNDWLQSGFLRAVTSSSPLGETRAVQNHSWIGTTGTPANDIDITRRLDFVVHDAGALVVVGVNNGTSTTLPALLCQGYNSISVGRSDGQHSAGTTTLEGAGRVKPELVAPDSVTSFSTPQVASAAGLLAQVGASSPHSLAGEALPLVVRALLLAGATQAEFPTWDRTATRPLDERFGAGELNILRAYRLLDAGRASASNLADAPDSAWAQQTISGGQTLNYFFEVAGSVPAPFTAAMVWHRRINDGTAGPNWSPAPATLANLGLELRAAAGFVAGSAVDASDSPVDNLEFLRVAALPPGRYVLRVSAPVGTANTALALAWHTLPSVTPALLADAGETGGANLQFSLTRSGNLAFPLRVPLAWGGTATAGSDYASPPSSVLIPAGSASATIMLTPQGDALAEGAESVELTVTPDFSLGGGGTATATLQDRPVDAWTFAQFTPTERADPLISGPDADPDGDGLSNRTEYALGGNPKDAASAPAPLLDDAGPALRLHFNRVADPEVIYRVRATQDLTDWTAAPIWTSSGSENVVGPVVVEDPVPLSAQDLRLLRLEVE